MNETWSGQPEHISQPWGKPIETTTVRIERLCEVVAANQEQFQQSAARFGAAAPLDRVITGVRAGTDPALLAADLDALDEAFARHGVDNLTGNDRAYRPIPGTGEHPIIRAWECPAARKCPRLIPHDGTGTPVCALTSLPLTLTKLRSR